MKSITEALKKTSRFAGRMNSIMTKDEWSRAQKKGEMSQEEWESIKKRYEDVYGEELK